MKIKASRHRLCPRRVSHPQRVHRERKYFLLRGRESYYHQREEERALFPFTPLFVRRL